MTHRWKRWNVRYIMVFKDYVYRLNSSELPIQTRLAGFDLKLVCAVMHLLASACHRSPTPQL
jgi:hypothetical protein